MNKTSRTEEPYEQDTRGFNQNPASLSADLTTNQDLNGIVNEREQASDKRSPSPSEPPIQHGIQHEPTLRRPSKTLAGPKQAGEVAAVSLLDGRDTAQPASYMSIPIPPPPRGREGGDGEGGPPNWRRQLKKVVVKFGSFIGPGFMISVAYIDPGNYSTGVAAGATFEYRLLFVVLMANLFAIFLQTLCIKLGTVSGLNLAQCCRLFLPPWMNYILYFFAEAAIIATDIAEVIGFAIGLNLLIPAIPLVAGCAISIVDVMLLLLFYNPHGTMRGLRLFELFITFLVLGVVVCFCIQLSLIKHTSIGTVFRGFLPSDAIRQSEGLYQACGILGATVMPHSLYLGSGIVQPRLREYDESHGLAPETRDNIDDSSEDGKDYYIPSLQAIKHCYRFSAIELAISLFTFALFVNSAIVIVSGASLFDNPAAPEADIFGIHDLLSRSISPAAGTIFALSLLLSGVSAGIVCTISGQMVSEGALRWKVRPWLRRLITRSISIIPSVVIAAAVGRSGLNDALNASQVVLSIVLPFVTAPLIYFTSRVRYMTIAPGSDRSGGVATTSEAGGAREAGSTSMENSWYTTTFGILLWITMAVLNVANLVLLGLGK
ncbi:unnamed protein product [Clonostachys chloroleuca]|uniref:Manganese transporter SMF1 n=1 Tax=Clonostachys chloroleuca TaxID=1926264 RepID=A0AA35M7K8_9HYPO|nr:unnamed protein product [Clonostachys chloroleuca]